MTDPRHPTEIGRLLNEARQQRHLSIRAAAKLAGVPAATVQGWLNGRHLPTPALRPQFEALAAALGLDGATLIDWSAPRGRGRGDEPPYVGLRPFEVADADTFFGRDEEIARLAAAVTRTGTGVIALIGASGAGKSSLLSAGLLGRAGAPGGPLAGREASLITGGQIDTAEVPPGTHLLVIDQFEEVLLSPAPAQSIARVVALGATMTVVLGVRSDAFARLSEHRGLAPALEAPLLIAPLSDAEVRAVIAGPAGRRGVRVQSGLVERLLRDLGPLHPGEPDGQPPLPLLSNALLATWAAGQGASMTLADYETTGGLATAIEQLAEGVHAGLDAGQQEVARDLFLRLLRSDGDLISTVPVPWAELPDAAAPVAAAFTEARILTTTATSVRISHQSLLQFWPRLGRWVEEGRARLRVREHLAASTRIWLENDRSADTLLPLERLPLFADMPADFDAFGEATPQEREFLTATRSHVAGQLDQERRTSRRLRRRGQVVTGLGVVALALAVVLALPSVQAVGDRRQAQARMLASQAWSLRAPDPNLQAQMALAADDLADTTEGRSVLLSATGLDVPARWPGAPSAVVATPPAGGWVARGNGDGTVTVWDADRVTTDPGRRLAVAPGRQLFALAAVDAGGRRLLAVGGAEGVRQLWDVTDEPLRVAELTASGSTTAAAFDASGTRLAFGGPTGGLTLLDVTRPDAPAQIAERPDEAAVTGVAFGPDGVLYASGGEGTLRVFDTALSPRPDAAIPGGGPRTLAVGVSPDGRWLVAGLASDAIGRWRLDDGDPAWAGSVAEFGSWVNGVAFSRAGRLAVGSSDQKVWVLDAATGQVERSLPGPSLVTSVGWLGEAPIGGSSDGTLWAWSAQPRQLRAGGAVAWSMAADGAGERWLAASIGTEQYLLLWDVARGFAQMPRVPAPPGVRLSSSVILDDAGSTLFAGTRDAEVVSWRLGEAGASEPRVQKIGASGSLAALALNPQGTLLAASQYTGESTYLATRAPDGTLTPVATLPTPTPQPLSFNADGTLLVLGIGDNAVQVWNVADPTTPVLVGALPDADPAPLSAAMPRTPRVLVGSESGNLALWDIHDPARPAAAGRLPGARGSFYSLAVTPDEGTVLAAGVDQVVWGWRPADRPDAPAYFLDGRMGAVTEVVIGAGRGAGRRGRRERRDPGVDAGPGGRAPRAVRPAGRAADGAGAGQLSPGGGPRRPVPLRPRGREADAGGAATPDRRRPTRTRAPRGTPAGAGGPASAWPTRVPRRPG